MNERKKAVKNVLKADDNWAINSEKSVDIWQHASNKKIIPC